MELKFRNLRADEIDVRIGSVNKGGAALLLYKDARADMNILDETVGPLNWQRKHEVIDGKLFCTISVFDPDKNEWVSKQDVGTESYTEKEKGQSSDSFKRACVNLGIGRSLYTAPNIFFFTNQLDKYTIENGKSKCYDTFSVIDIQYDNLNNIANVTIRNNSNGITLTFGNPILKTIESSTPENMQNTPTINTIPATAPSDRELHERKKINQKQKDYLITECEKLFIKLEDLLALYKVQSLDDITFRQYDNMLKNWDRIVKKLNNFF